MLQFDLTTDDYPLKVVAHLTCNNDFFISSSTKPPSNNFYFRINEKYPPSWNHRQPPPAGESTKVRA